MECNVKYRCDHTYSETFLLVEINNKFNLENAATKMIVNVSIYQTKADFVTKQ